MTNNIFLNNNMPNPFPGFNNGNNPFLQNKSKSSEASKFSKGVAAGKNGTLIHIILDESSSMSPQQDSTISAFNEWLHTQQRQDGKCNVTISKFDGDKVKYVVENEPIENIADLNRETYSPNGMTNLYDAIGDNMKRIDRALRKTKKKYRPGVITVILTDGAENCSQEYNQSNIKEMVSSRENKDWVFLFLGANIDAFAAGGAMGFNANSTLQYDVNNMHQTYNALSNVTTSVRNATALGASGATLQASASYSNEDRIKAMK